MRGVLLIDSRRPGRGVAPRLHITATVQRQREGGVTDGGGMSEVCCERAGGATCLKGPMGRGRKG